MKTKRSKKTSPSKKRSVAAKATWASPKVHKARSARHHVRVGGEEYRSVAAAFGALKLNMAAHQKVRRELVAAGRVTHEGRRFTLAG